MGDGSQLLALCKASVLPVVPADGPHDRLLFVVEVRAEYNLPCLQMTQEPTGREAEYDSGL